MVSDVDGDSPYGGTQCDRETATRRTWALDAGALVISGQTVTTTECDVTEVRRNRSSERYPLAFP
jgi:hypothetical protein